MKSPLPSFERPPVREVILGIQFESLKEFRGFHYGLLSSKFPENPVISEQPPIAPTFEVFGPKIAKQELRFEVTEAQPPVRYFFHSKTGDQLIQVQPDRLLRNWTGQGHTYPRYTHQRNLLIKDIQRFSDFTAEHKLGELKINQCEVTYTNIIEFDGNSLPFENLHEVFRVWSSDYADDQGRTIEDASVAFKYLLRGDDGAPYGRLHVDIRGVYRASDMKPALKFELTARGKPNSQSVESSCMFLDKGREAIVRAFASLTRDEMHRKWGKIDE